MSIPGYWMNETSGVLKPVVLRYLEGDELSPEDVAIMRAYLRQWINGDFYGVGPGRLRATVDGIDTTAKLRAWLADALNAGIDPL